MQSWEVQRESGEIVREIKSEEACNSTATDSNPCWLLVLLRPASEIPYLSELTCEVGIISR